MESFVFPVAEVYIGGGLIGLLVAIILIVMILKLLGVL